MLDFLMISTKDTSKGVREIYPTFRIDKRNDIMTRGGDFYAVWLEDEGLWSTDEVDALQLIDKELDIYAEEEEKKKGEHRVKVLHCCVSSTKMVDSFHQYCKHQLRDRSHTLDQRLIFSNQKTTKRDYASKKLPYPLQEGSIEAYDRLMSVLYSPDEREKLEWAIGAIVNGDSVDIQKFIVLYGAAGTGKSTVLNIIQQLFDGYYSVFDAKALGSSNDAFALEPFKNNPLVAIQHDGDLSRIEDNTRLNSLVSHELMTVNEKFKSLYSERFHSFLFMGTNKPVRITDAKSGLIRRLIDVSPTGEKIPLKEYRSLMSQITFELGAIAWHCLQVYEEDPNKYDDYIPITMIGASNDFYNFVLDSYLTFLSSNDISLRQAWEMYKTYCEDAKVAYPFSQRAFKEELKNYFDDFHDRYQLPDGSRVRNYYTGFKSNKFDPEEEKEKESNYIYETHKIEFKEQESIFDQECAGYSAQYANDEEYPQYKWENVKTKLSDLDTHKLHYVRVPENHIVIDFDIPDESGNKSFEKNLEAASKWPATYSELSKSGKGIHLHYIYNGDPSTLSRTYDDHIEVKVFTGKSSLRRKLTKCNNRPIATISSGLPVKGEYKVVNQDILMNEKGLRTFIRKNLNKEYHNATKPSIDFIFDQLEKQYASGMPYDVSDMQADVINFAASSTHQSEYCLKLVTKMHFKSETEGDAVKDKSNVYLFFDFEVFPNMVQFNYALIDITDPIAFYEFIAKRGPVFRLTNPTPADFEPLLGYKWIGFNNLRYDNPIAYGIFIGNTVEDTYALSRRLVSNDRAAIYRESRNWSFTDIYDLSSKKQSLKKWEIELANEWTKNHPEDIYNPFRHDELGLDWDKPVPKELWSRVAEYCDNDVITTVALFFKLTGDWSARLVLSDVSGLTPNDTTNSHTQRIIFGKERNPQSQFNYRFLGDVSDVAKRDDDITLFDSKGRPVFNGYKYEYGKSTYLGYEVGEGGWVWAKPGMYGRVVTYDIASMHPSSIIAENLFGPYTQRFKDIFDARLAIKHRDFESAKKMLNGALAKHLGDEGSAKALSGALKIAINSVYGLTSAKFDNPFRDKRNVDNIVAKRGALFMINLKTEVERLGYSVIHVKTDSIKIENPDEKIQKFIYEYGAKYGYTFEIEHIFERFCIVNDAVYVGKLAADDPEEPGQWTATGKQFQVPYIFKKLFSKEPIEFSDMCETMSVTTALYLDFNEGLPKGEHNYRFIGKVGQFTPMIDGIGAGYLMRESKDKNGNVKYDSATGAKGFKWMESEMVRTLNLYDKIDKKYYERQVDQAVIDISKFGDFEWFTSENTPRDSEDSAVPW